MSDERLTVQEYADRCRLHVQTVYSLIKRGKMPHAVERFGRTIRIVVPRIEERKSA